MSEKPIPVKPIFLLADSQMLFWRDSLNRLFPEHIVRLLREDGEGERICRAAYIGAANLDEPAFYEIFSGVFSGIPGVICRMIPSAPSEEDFQFLKTSGIILLAGGEPWTGWKVIEEKFQEIITSRYHQGAVLIGVSAGAILLGMGGWKPSPEGDYDLFSSLQLVPAFIDAHDEARHWERLEDAVKKTGLYARGFGIPYGGALVFHPDYSFEALRRSVAEFTLLDNGFHNSFIVPGSETEKRDPETDSINNTSCGASVQTPGKPD